MRFVWLKPAAFIYRRCVEFYASKIFLALSFLASVI